MSQTPQDATNPERDPGIRAGEQEVNGHPVRDFNSCLRETAQYLVDGQTMLDHDPTADAEHIMEWRGILGLVLYEPVDEDEGNTLEDAVQLWLQTIRSTMTNKHMDTLVIRGEEVPNMDLEQVDLLAQLSRNSGQPGRFCEITLSWDEFLGSITERRLVIYPEPYSEKLFFRQDGSDDTLVTDPFQLSFRSSDS